MNNADIYNIITNYMSTTLSRGANRFVHTKKENLLENTVDIFDYKENIQLSTELYDSHQLCFIKSIKDIQFKFQNEYLIDAVLALNERQQTIVYYKYFLDMTDKEIAKKLNITRQAVTSTKLYILQKLRQELESKRNLWR